MEMVKEDNRLELSARVYLNFLQTVLLAHRGRLIDCFFGCILTKNV